VEKGVLVEFNLTEIEERIKTFFNEKPPTRQYKIVLYGKESYRLFQKSLQEAFQKQYKPNLDDSKNKKTAPKRSNTSQSK
jgi:hypothetical protein